MSFFMSLNLSLKCQRFCYSPYCVNCIFESPKQFSNLTLNNIEALASGEGEPNIYCIGTGSIDCEGRKVLTKYNPLSLDYTE